MQTRPFIHIHFLFGKTMPLLISLLFLLFSVSAYAQESYERWPDATIETASQSYQNAYQDIALNVALPGDPLAADAEAGAFPQTVPQDARYAAPVPVKPNTLTPSRMEAYYAGRIVDELQQFGYDMFGSKAGNRPQEPLQMPAGAVQDDFILSIGDKLDVTLRGQINEQHTYTVNNDGLLIINQLPPVPAAGRSIAQIQAALKAVTTAMPNIDIYLSLDRVRQINVLVIGNVGAPGRQTLTVFNNILDALSSAGGIRKDGSLRRIKLVRQGRTDLIDLYALLIHGSDAADVRLQDGDRLIVPPLGPTIAIAGGVKRPGIYEIRRMLRGMDHAPQDASEALSLQEVLDMAGGVLAPGQNRFVKLALTAGGEEIVSEITDPFQPQFTDGAILSVSPTDEKRAGQVELAGHTRKEGLHALSLTPTLAKLLDSDGVLGPDIYPLIGVIERWDEDSMARQHLVFPLDLVLKGQFDQRLEDGDSVHLFSNAQIQNLLGKDKTREQAELQPERELVSLGSGMGDPAEAKIADPIIRDVLREHAVYLRGEVRLPGAYPVASGATLAGILAVSGGLTLEASNNRIEITSASLGREGAGTHRVKVDLDSMQAEDVALTPGDTVRVNQSVRKLKDETVVIQGEVLQPGEYNLMPGDRLSTLLARAGGLNPEAYPEGTIFSRAQERRSEEQRFRAAARDMERAIAVAIEKDGENKPDERQLAMARDLARELRDVEAVGRITVEASPDALIANPELDVLLEPGDRIFIPKRPSTVRVRGEVLSPANLQFRSGKSPRDYLMEAGGTTHFADKDRTFVIYPDGSAQPLQVSAWNYKPAMIPPGSTIVVPRDPKPFDFMETAKDVSQILSNLAIAGIAVDELQDDN